MWKSEFHRRSSDPIIIHYSMNVLYSTCIYSSAEGHYATLILNNIYLRYISYKFEKCVYNYENGQLKY